MNRDLGLLYRQEARRQTQIAMAVVDGMLEMPDAYIPESSPGDGIDKGALRQIRDKMDAERNKLDRNEATVALIGVMKAGKSTIASAIVGSELLPRREQAMTTFPTIISHVPGRVEPELDFPLAPAFLALAERIRGEIEADRGGAAEVIGRSPAADDLQFLADEICSGNFSLAEHAQGFQAVRTLLARVNDLTRLARALGVDDPISSEGVTHEDIPRIEVEFVHLDTTAGLFPGTLSLVDTPGPDEAGTGGALKEIAQQQLMNASAIILVIDSTKLGNTADDDLRQLLALLPPGADDRLFVFLNRYDQRQERDDGLDPEARAEAERRRTAQTCRTIALRISDVLGLDVADKLAARTFPTAANLALLSNQARRTLQYGGALDPTRAWVLDFARFCMPDAVRRTERLGDRVRVEEAIADAWADSRFETPLREAIGYSATNAWRMLVQGCLDAMKEAMRSVYERLDVGRNALAADTQRMIDTIGELDEDLEAIEEIHGINQERMLSIGKQLANEVNELSDEIKKRIQELIDAFDKSYADFLKFSKERRWWVRPPRKKSKKRSNEFTVARSLIDAIEQLPAFLSFQGSGRARRIVFSSRSEAQKTMRTLLNYFSSQLTEALRLVRHERDDAIEATTRETREWVRKSFEARWKQIQSRVQDLLGVELEDPNYQSNATATVKIEASAAMIGSKTVTEKSAGLGAATKRGAAWLIDALDLESYFDSNPGRWGKEDVTYFNVDIGAIAEAATEQLEAEIQALDRETMAALTALDHVTDDYASRLGDAVRSIRAYLEQERIARDDDLGRYQRLGEEIRSLADQASDLRKEATILREEVSR